MLLILHIIVVSLTEAMILYFTELKTLLKSSSECDWLTFL